MVFSVHVVLATENTPTGTEGTVVRSTLPNTFNTTEAASPVRLVRSNNRYDSRALFSCPLGDTLVISNVESVVPNVVPALVPSRTYASCTGVKVMAVGANLK